MFVLYRGGFNKHETWLTILFNHTVFLKIINWILYSFNPFFPWVYKVSNLSLKIFILFSILIYLNYACHSCLNVSKCIFSHCILFKYLMLSLYIFIDFLLFYVKYLCRHRGSSNTISFWFVLSSEHFVHLKNIIINYTNPSFLGSCLTLIEEVKTN